MSDLFRIKNDYVVLQKKRCNDYGYSLLDKEMFFFKKSLFTHFEKVVQDFKGRGTICS